MHMSIATVPCVLIVKLHFPHNRSVVPVTEDDKGEAVVHVPPQLSNLLREVLLLTVHHKQSA